MILTAEKPAWPWDGHVFVWNYLESQLARSFMQGKTSSDSRIARPPALAAFLWHSRIGVKGEPNLSKERACRIWNANRGQAEEPSGCAACWGSGALKSFSVLSLECRTRYSQWTLKRSTGTAGSRGIHYSRHKIFYSGLQHIIIQMSRAQ